MRQTRAQAKIANTNGNNPSVQLKERQELEVIINTFNNQELCDLLGIQYNSKHLKTGLRKRALSLLQTSFATTQHKIRALINNRKVTIETPATQMYHQDMNMVVSQQGNGTTNHPNGTSNGVVVYNQNMTQQNIPMTPNIKLKKLAFFEVMGVLLKPTMLPASPNQRIQEGTYYFQLTPQQATDLASNRDIRNAPKLEHVIQVQLRFCLLETSTEQDDLFPPNVIVKVNNKLCNLPNPIPTNKPGVEPKRPPQPVNITHNVKLSPTIANQISVSWCTEYTRGYVISVYLVRKLSSIQLLNGMNTGQKIQPSDVTRSMIKAKINEDADCEVTLLKVSLVCPLGKMRMTTPCRASTCSHMQCFDAFTYLQMNEKKPTWNCPVCDKPAPYESLVIDGYFQEVLSSPELSSDTNEIQLNNDGSWTTHVVGSDSQSLDTPLKKYQSIEVISDDLEVITTETKPFVKLPSMTSLEPTSTTNSTSTVPIEQSVDLTQSDSDDDLPLKRSQPPPKQIVSAPAPVHATTNARTNDNSIISLDSPTPPSSPANNISTVYVDTPPSHLMNSHSGVSSTTHSNWTNPAINSLNYNILPSYDRMPDDPLGGALNDYYQRQLLQNNSPNLFPYPTADDENRY